MGKLTGQISLRSLRYAVGVRRTKLQLGRSISVLGLAALVSVLVPVPAASGPAAPFEPEPEPEFDLDTGNAVKDIAIPTVTPVIREHVSPGANDVTLVLRWTTLMSEAWFDALAPYHPTAVGISSRLGRLPEDQVTTRNMNISVLYASYRVFSSLRPESEDVWRDMLTSVGLDPDDTSEDTDSAIGIGNLAGDAVVASRERDGMNQLGDEGDRRYNQVPYADYTGYQPVNTAYELTDPGRWQPAIVSNGDGLFEVQQFVTPQMRLTRPYTYDDPSAFSVPPPIARRLDEPGPHRRDHRRQTAEVLEASAELTDEQKLAAELFDDKFASLGNINLFLGQTRGLSMEEGVQVGLTFNIANFDTIIAVWNEKHRHDAVRPFSAVRYFSGDEPVTAWGGPGEGTVSDLAGSEWQSYIGAADHPEYPSATAAVCAAQAQAGRRHFGSDDLGFSVDFPQGSSEVEPGVTPATDMELTFDTWTELETQCALSRLWGGVHFREAIEAGPEIGQPIGDLAYEYVQAHVDGTAPPP